MWRLRPARESSSPSVLTAPRLSSASSSSSMEAARDSASTSFLSPCDGGECCGVNRSDGGLKGGVSGDGRIMGWK